MKGSEGTMDKENLGKLLVLLRQEKGISQREFANRLNISASCVCKWEKGYNLPDVDFFDKIADIYDISCDELHHPEKTLEKMLNGTPPEDKEPPKKHIKRAGLIAGACCVVLLILLGYVGYRYAYPQIKMLDSAYAEDDDWGVVYEISYRTDRELSVSVLNEHAAAIRERWEAGDLSVPDTDILKLVYYKGWTKMALREEAYRTTYLFWIGDAE